MKIYTRRGDQGQTDLFGGERVAKSDARVEAYGEVDELNACVGAAAAESQHADLRGLLQRVQSTLFDLGATLATPDPERREKANIPRASEEDVAELEAAIDRLEGELPPLRSFILPGGSRASAAFHVARTVCRRAERRVVALGELDDVDAAGLRYLNRLSDFLFVLARIENQHSRVADVEWVGRDR